MDNTCEQLPVLVQEEVTLHTPLKVIKKVGLPKSFFCPLSLQKYFNAVIRPNVDEYAFPSW